MSNSRKYMLTRRFPSGKVAIVPDVTLARVRMYVSMCLVDNGVASRKEADVFARQTTAASLGTQVEHSSGFSFVVSLAERQSGY